MFAFLFVALGFITHADESLPILQAGGTTYSHVTIFNVTATDIYFTSDQGVGNLKLKDLSPALQKHFHFDAHAASVVEQKESAANRQYYLQVTAQNAARTQAAANNSSSTAQDPSATTEPQTGKQIWAKSFLDQKAPDLVVEKWLTPEPDYHGKFVLIDFWATWCPSCRAAIPELNRYHEEFGDKLVVIGISDETESAVRALTDPQIEYSVAIDTQARMKNEVGVTGIPHCLLIDPQGIVRWEGFPFEKGYELTDQVVSDIISRYSN